MIAAIQKTHDSHRVFTAVKMDLSKAFDYISYKLFIVIKKPIFLAMQMKPPLLLVV